MSTVFKTNSIYNYKVLILKQEVVTPIHYSMILVDLYKNNDHVINFTTYDMRSNFEAFSKNKIDVLYINGIIQT